jgi:hypothetical protein
LNNEKNEKRKLEERIKELESQQVHAAEVKVEEKFLNQIHKVR